MHRKSKFSIVEPRHSVALQIARYSGFCEGVQRAYRIALEQTALHKPVFMLGNLVHNAQVVQKFKDLGVKIVSSLAEIPANQQGLLIISAHGASPAIYTEAKKLKLAIIDTTCPWVKKAQKIAKQLAEEGRLVIIIGDRGHKEVIGLIGWADKKAFVVETLKDTHKLISHAGKKAGILAQTTQSREHFKNMAGTLQKIFKDLKVFDTICDATSKRQAAAVSLAEKVDCMLVVGDKMSANTKRLTQLCKATGTKTYQIQTARELNLAGLKACRKIGLTAGASTPEWVVEEVKKAVAP